MEFAGYDSRGSSSISGEAYYRIGGGVVLAAGSEVVLVPDTAYTRELWEPARSGRYSGVANFDPRYFKYRRSTVADGNGYFRFTGLPAGSYIVQTHCAGDRRRQGGVPAPPGDPRRQCGRQHHPVGAESAVIPRVMDNDRFHGAHWPLWAGAVRGAMQRIEQAPQRSRKGQCTPPKAALL